MVKIVNEVDFSRFDNDNFGNEWVVSIPKDCIKGATLLSKEEYEKYRNNIPKTEDWWWLRSAGYIYDGACYVLYDGVVYSIYRVYSASYGVRPALILNLKSSNLEVGDKVDFGGHLFTIISNNLAICDDFIGKGCFRRDREAKDANDYEKSDVKKIVDDWFKKAYDEYEG